MDRGVASVDQTSSVSGGAGFEFDTVAHDRFNTASWQFEVKPDEKRSLLICTAIFAARRRYFFLAPILYCKRSAILLDLTLLKNAVEASARLMRLQSEENLSTHYRVF